MSSSTITPAPIVETFPKGVEPTRIEPTQVEPAEGLSHGYGGEELRAPARPEAAIIEASVAQGAQPVSHDRAVTDLPGYVDPAPFVGTRDVGEASPAPANGLAIPDIVPLTIRTTEHPAAQALREVAARIESGDITLPQGTDRLSTEASLAAVLAELLKGSR